MLEKLKREYNSIYRYLILCIDHNKYYDCIKHYCDDETCIFKFSKLEFIGTFNEFRKDIFFRDSQLLQRERDINIYYQNKQEHKLKNKKLRETFQTEKEINFTKILKEFVTFNEWLKFPSILDFNIINARYVGCDDGNCQEFVAEDDNNYYYIIASGS